MSNNSLSIEVYDSDGKRVDQIKVNKAQMLTFGTCYPGGLFTDCSFFVPRNITHNWRIKAAQRVKVRNNTKLVWEGKIESPLNQTGRAEGTQVTCYGYWGNLLGNRTLDKPWADTRLGENVWTEPTSAYDGFDVTASGKVTIDHNNHLLFSPEEQGFTLAQYARLVYTAPTGQTVKRLTADYALQETALVTPEKVLHNDAPAGANTFTDLTLSYDGDTTTASGCTLTSDDYLYIGARAETPWFSLIRFDMGATNINAATLSAQYSKVDSTGAESWAALTITDGTAAAGKPLAQDGDITFTKPADWGEITVNDSRMRWIRLKASANLTLTGFWEIYIGEVQSWRVGLYNQTTGGTIWSTDTQGTGSVDHTLATPSNTVWLYYSSRAKQTPPANGTVYGKFTNVTVYTETGAINLYEVARDVRGGVSELSADESLISSALNFSLVPFITDGPKHLTEILNTAAQFGSAAALPCAAGVRESEIASDGKPILFAEAQPVLTDYDYSLRMEDFNAGDVAFEQDTPSVKNWIIVQYTDAGGTMRRITPDDDVSLKDTTSIDTFGERHETVTVDTASAATALNIGKRYLAARKDVQWRANNEIVVKGRIRAKGGYWVPASEVRAGKRVKIENYHDNLTGSLTSFVLLITATRYNDQDETCALGVGRPNPLSVLTARLADGRSIRTDMRL